MVIVRAPVRVSFGGGGTDLAAYYAHFGGLVVSTAITRYCSAVVCPSVDGSIRIHSADYRTWEMYPRGEIPQVEGILSLPKAAIARFADLGLRKKGVDLYLFSEVPPGSGLGSSSAMAVALVRALAAHLGLLLSAMEVAELACSLEIELLRMPIGKQDQYASACGGLNTITFTANGVYVEPLVLRKNVLASLQSSLLLFSTGQTHNSASVLDQQRRDTQTKPEVIRSLHQIKLLALEMREALLAGNLERFGRLLDLGWQEKRRLSKNVSTTAIDCYYETARGAGALGGKIVGAGGGGYLLLYCPIHGQRRLRESMTELGLVEMLFDFDFAGVQVITDALTQEERMSFSSETSSSSQHAPVFIREQASSLSSPVSWFYDRL